MIALDPGGERKGTAYALALEGAVVRVGMLPGAPCLATAASVVRAAGGAAGRVVVERPEYQGARTAASRPADLLELAWCGAAWAYVLAGALGWGVLELAPSAWKGTAPKPITHGRAWAVLTPAERVVLGGARTAADIEAATERGATRRWAAGVAWYPRTSTLPDVLDATAILLVASGRLQLTGRRAGVGGE